MVQIEKNFFFRFITKIKKTMTHQFDFYYVNLGNLGNFSHQKLNKSPVQKRYKTVR